MPRLWLRHPARTIRTPTVCPTGADRYASPDLARSTAICTGHPARAVACEACGGWHLEHLARQENR